MKTRFKINSKNSRVYLAITIALFLVIVVGATYAYFASVQDTDDRLNIYVSTNSESYILTGTTSGSIDINVNSTMMMESKISGKAIAKDTADVDLHLVSPANNIKTTCTYDAIWIWESEDIYTTPDGYLGEVYENKEGKVCGEYNSSTCNGEKIGDFPYEFSIAVINDLIKQEVDISRLEKNGNKVIIAEGLTIESVNSTDGTNVNYTMQMAIYNIPYDQVNIKAKNFKGHFAIENVNCEMEEIPTYYYGFFNSTDYEVLEEMPVVTDYTDLNKNIFVRTNNPYSTERELCIINNGLHCFKNSNFDEEKIHVIQSFGENLENVDNFSSKVCFNDSTSLGCMSSRFSCIVGENNSQEGIMCSDYSTGDVCEIYENGKFSCNESEQSSTYYYGFIDSSEYENFEDVPVTLDYTTLNKKVFVRTNDPYSTNREVCILKDGLNCFKNSSIDNIYNPIYNYSKYEQERMRKLFGEDNCEETVLGGPFSTFTCNSSDYFCTVDYDGTVGCTENKSHDACRVDGQGNIKCIDGDEEIYYYAFGTPTIFSSTNYITLNKSLFIRDDNPSTPDREMCLLRTYGNPGLHCIKNNNVEYEQQHVQEIFSDVSCEVKSSEVFCDGKDFYCYVFSDGSVNCKYSLGIMLYCRISSDGKSDCDYF